MSISFLWCSLRLTIVFVMTKFCSEQRAISSPFQFQFPTLCGPITHAHLSTPFPTLALKSPALSVNSTRNRTLQYFSQAVVEFLLDHSEVGQFWSIHTQLWWQTFLCSENRMVIILSLTGVGSFFSCSAMEFPIGKPSLDSFRSFSPLPLQKDCVAMIYHAVV